MAVTYVMIPITNQTITVQSSYTWPNNSPTGATYTDTKSTTKTYSLTFPTFSSFEYLYVYFQHTEGSTSTNGADVTGRNYSYRVKWSGFTSSYYSNTGYIYNGSSYAKPSNGATVSIEFKFETTSLHHYGVTLTTTTSANATLGGYLCVGAYLPSITSSSVNPTIYAADVIQLARILNISASSVSQGSALSDGKTTFQSICSDARTKVYTTADSTTGAPGSSHPSAITFNTTQPTQSNIVSVITNLTDHWVYSY